MGKARDVCLLACAWLLASCNQLSGADELRLSERLPSVGDPDAVSEGPRSSEAGTFAFDGGSSDTASSEPGTEVDAGPRLHVFVTSVGTGGNLGGFEGADERCNEFASRAKLGGAWVAWLSVKDASDALDRLTSDGPWYLVNGPLAVRSRTDLQNDSLAHPINVNESGGLVTDDGVWTGTRGGKFALRDCAGWRTSSLATEGTFGSTGAKTSGWTGGIPDACNASHRLYCFEK